MKGDIAMSIISNPFSVALVQPRTQNVDSVTKKLLEIKSHMSESDWRRFISEHRHEIAVKTGKVFM